MKKLLDVKDLCDDLSLTMMVDNSQLLSIFIAAATTLIYLVVTRRRREADAARGADVVVVLCGDKPRARELLFAIPAVTLYECATFGDQLRLTTSFSARRDASFSSVIVIEPYVNFEGLDTMMAQPMITNFHRSMFRAAAGAVPVLEWSRRCPSCDSNRRDVSASYPRCSNRTARRPSPPKPRRSWTWYVRPCNAN